MASSMFLGLGALLVFAGVVIAFSIIGVLTGEKRAVGRSVAAVQAINSAPKELATEIDVVLHRPRDRAVQRAARRDRAVR